MNGITYVTEITPTVVAWLGALPEGAVLALDTETTGLDPHVPGFLVGAVCVADAAGTGVVVDGRNRALVRALLTRVFRTPGVTVWAHNAGYDAWALMRTADLRLSSLRCSATMARTIRWGVDRATGLDRGFSLKTLRPTTQDAQDALKKQWADTLVARAEAALPAGLSESERHRRISAETRPQLGSDWLAHAVCGLPPSTPELVAYVAEDTVETARLVEEMQGWVARNPRATQAVELDQKTDAAFRWVGYRGLRVDRIELTRVLSELEARLDAEASFFGFRPWTGNKSRVEWVKSLGITGLAKTGAGQVSLDKASRKGARVPASSRADWERFCAAIDAASVLNKLREFERLSAADGRIHPTFSANAARTGRMSAAGPAVQNITRPGEGIPDLRRLLQADGGRVLVACDLSHVEPSVMAAMSRCPRMASACRRGDTPLDDPYVAVGQITRGAVAAELGEDGSLTARAKAIRSESKVVLLALMYGMGDTALAAALDVPKAKAKKLRESVLSGFPTLRDWLEDTRDRAESMRWGSTPWGRPLPAIAGKPYVAQNHTIQGAAGDVFKVMACRVSEMLRGIPGARLWLAVHDELEVECHPEDAAQVTEILATCMHMHIDLHGQSADGAGVEIWGEPAFVGERWGKI